MIVANNGKPFLQSTSERKPYIFDVAPRLLHYASAPTLSSATATLTTPAGSSASLTTACTVSGTEVTATVIGSSELAATSGTSYYILDIVALLSNSDTCVGRCYIKVLD